METERIPAINPDEDPDGWAIEDDRVEDLHFAQDWFGERFVPRRFRRG